MATRRKAPTTLARPVVKESAKIPVNTRIDESRTSVLTAGSLNLASKPDIIEIPSDSSSSYSDVSDEEEDASGADDNRNGATQEPKPHSTQQPTPPETTRLPSDRHSSRAAATDPDTAQDAYRIATSQDQEDPDASDAEPTSPTFGDLVRSNETIDIPVALAGQHGHQPSNPATALSHPHQLRPPPTLSSLGTVLNQALRTDDTDLLDSCLNTHDLTTVRATIQRMDSSLAGVLLTKLAARLHRRPGRAQSLMSWVQWALVAHGGALAAQPDVTAKLAELSRVLEERARGLNSLLALKGKLDMLEAQMQLRRENRVRGRSRYGAESEEDESEDDQEEGIVYVEGEEDEADGLANGMPAAGRDGQEGGDALPVVNGARGESDDDDEEGSEDDMDVDEDELADESLDEDDVDFDDVDDESGEEDDSDAEVAAPPAKVRKVKQAFSKRK